MKYIQKLFFLLAFFLLSFSFCFAQPTYTSKSKKAIKNYVEALKNISDGNPEAAKECLYRAIKEDENFIEPHITLAYLFGDSKQYQKAIDEIKIALDINPNFFAGNYYLLGQLEMKLGIYKEARKHFQIFLSMPVENSEMKKSAQLEILNCDFAIPALQNPVPFKPINAGDGINSKNDEYFPSVTADEQLFLFTRKIPSDKVGSGWQEDFYVSEKMDGKWMKAHGIGAKINTEGNEGAPCLSPDGQILFFVACESDFGYGNERQGYGSCDIFYSFKNGNDWTKPQNVGQPVCTKWWETQPSFSSDGKTLYFIRGVVDGNGKKQQDIYISVLKEYGKWSVPTKLSNKINTPYDEESVFIHPDNQTLYFSSDGHPGMGGLDIFISRRKPNGEWGEPVNLGYPINTFGDENSLLVSRDGKIAYFASDMEGGYGGLDIYSFDLYEAARPGKTIYVKGKVFDADTKLPLEAAIEVIDLETGANVFNAVSGKTKGEFLICLPVNKNYAFNASKSGYLFNSKNFALNENKEYKPFDVVIPLSPIKESIIIPLNNVFFETAKYDLKGESKYELNKLVDFLKKNSTLKIELYGHTDNVGDKKANLVLSQNRAKAVCDYLIANGIAKERLTYKGFGDTVPVVLNDSDEHRQMNRRTEFKVISK